MLQKEIRHKWLFAFLVLFVLFLLANIILYPLFNSGDDVYLMYMLSGGYGNKPTNLLQYNYGWHPALGWLIKSLFTAWPSVNWYTVLLQVAQLFSCTALLYVALVRVRLIIGLVFIATVFLFIECWAILSLNYTFTSWLLAVAGIMLLLNTSSARSRFNLFVAGLLILLSGMLRLQITLVVGFLMLPALFFYAKPSISVWAPFLVGAACLLLLLNLQQSSYYRHHIPNWSQQEKVRQALFYSYNRPIDHKKDWNAIFKDSTEAVYYANHFYFDTSVFHPGRIMEINKSMTRVRDFSAREDWQIFKWLFLGLRIYLLLFAILFFIGWHGGWVDRPFIKCILPLGMVLLVYVYLQLFLKVTIGVHLGLQLLLLCYLLLAWKAEGNNRKYSLLYLVLFLLPIAWQVKRLALLTRENKEQHARFVCATGELNSHPDKLYIATDDALPLDYFYCWSLPADHKLANLVNKDRMLTQTFYSTLQRFSIKDPFAEAYSNDKIRILGSGVKDLALYYHFRYQLDVVFVSAPEKYDCLQVSKAQVDQRK